MLTICPSATAALACLQAQGLSPDVHTFTSLIAGCAYGRQAALARELLRQMQRRGLQPSPWTHNALLKVWLQQGFFVLGLQCRHLLLVLPGTPSVAALGCSLHLPHAPAPAPVACLPAQVECWTYGVDAGHALVRQMAQQGIEPDRATWSTLLACEPPRASRGLQRRRRLGRAPGAAAAVGTPWERRPAL